MMATRFTPTCSQSVIIQEWGKGQAITERSAQRIFRAADQILRSGRTEQATRDAG